MNEIFCSSFERKCDLEKRCDIDLTSQTDSFHRCLIETCSSSYKQHPQKRQQHPGVARQRTFDHLYCSFQKRNNRCSCRSAAFLADFSGEELVPLHSIGPDLDDNNNDLKNRVKIPS